MFPILISNLNLHLIKKIKCLSIGIIENVSIMNSEKYIFTREDNYYFICFVKYTKKNNI